MTNNKEALKQFVNSEFKALENERQLWESLWQDIADYIVPLRENISGDLLEGFRFSEKVFDGTAVSGAKLMADGLHSNLVSPSMKWFEYMFDEEGLNELSEPRIWLQSVVRSIYSRLTNSPFYNEFWNYLYDGVTIGTAILYMEYDKRKERYIFETIHPGECYIGENQFQEVDTVFRKRKLTAKKLVERFGEENLPSIVTMAYKSNNPFQKFEIIHAVFQRKNYDIESKLATKKPFASIWMMGSGEIISESGYDVFPYAVWRYLKSGKEAYGRSPAMYALLDTKTLNSIGKSNLKAGQLLVDPPLNVPSELKKVNLHPRGINYYNESNRLVSPVNMQIDLNAGINRQEDFRTIVEKHFHVEFFFMLSRSEREMTATEVMEKKSEKASVLGASIGRLNSEALNNTLNFIFEKEAKENKLPIPPSEIEGENVSIQYLGQLAKAQRRLFVTQGIRASVEGIAPILQIFPEAADNIDPDETAREILRANGFPETAILPKDDVRKKREQRAMAQQAQQQMEQIKEGTEVAKTASMVDKNSGTNIVKELKDEIEGNT